MTQEEVTAFYSEPEKYDSWIAEESARDILWKRRINKMLPHRSPGNLLDVGTGIGQFLHHAKHFFTNVTGSEVSESAIVAARERYNLDLLPGQIEDLNLPRESFDNISIFHVLEHVPDPSETIDVCRDLLRPQGTLTIAVPNDVIAWTSIVKRIGRAFNLKAFRRFSPNLGIARAGFSRGREIHLSHFTPAVLRRLVESRGLSVIEVSLDPLYAASGWKLLVHETYYALHRAIFACFRINRYEAIWLVCRKP
jgi:ubiquinone/menaquinone biosynthesis C-methylase UbiE